MFFLTILCILIVGFCILNIRYMNSYYYKNLLIFENRIVHKEDVPKNLDFVNLGSGYARFSFCYEDYNGIGFNFAQSPQCLEYDYKLLQQFSLHLKKGCIVCINMPIFIFGFEHYEELKYNAKYYGCLEKKYIHQYTKLVEIICTKFPILLAGKKAAYAILNKKVDCELMYDNCIIPKENIENYARAHWTVWKKQFMLNNTKKQSIEHLKPAISYNINLLNEMIDYCIKNEWKPILVTTPLSKELNNMFSDEFLKDILYDNIQKANNRNVPYFDFRTHKDYQDNSDMFWNGVDWLSKMGRKHFMKILLQAIGEI